MSENIKLCSACSSFHSPRTLTDNTIDCSPTTIRFATPTWSTCRCSPRSKKTRRATTKCASTPSTRARASARGAKTESPAAEKACACSAATRATTRGSRPRAVPRLSAHAGLEFPPRRQTAALTAASALLTPILTNVRNSQCLRGLVSIKLRHSPYLLSWRPYQPI